MTSPARAKPRRACATSPCPIASRCTAATASASRTAATGGRSSACGCKAGSCCDGGAAERIDCCGLVSATSDPPARTAHATTVAHLASPCRDILESKDPMLPTRIVSGGQTGADRAALDWAIRAGIPHGGWCPKGRLAVDGVIDARYRLTETDSDDYAVRTRLNVRDSDATLILNLGALDGGTALTAEHAHALGRPCLTLQLDAGPTASPADAASAIDDWMARGPSFEGLNTARFDIVGDIHGHADKLEALLANLGYRPRMGAWRHPDAT